MEGIQRADLNLFFCPPSDAARDAEFETTFWDMPLEHTISERPG